MNKQNTLTLQLTLDEINTLLTALGDRPYVEVYALMTNIQQQAEAQVKQQNENDQEKISKDTKTQLKK
ncbi:MAG: hypothetical protein V3U75_05890 [Methylococcaceae bacterium]